MKVEKKHYLIGPSVNALSIKSKKNQLKCVCEEDLIQAWFGEIDLIWKVWQTFGLEEWNNFENQHKI